MIVLTLFFVIPFERTDLCDIICSQLHINNLIEFGKSLTLSSWRCFLVWLVDRVVHLLSSWGWIATRDYSELPFPQLRNGKGVKKIHSQNSGTWREWITPSPRQGTSSQYQYCYLYLVIWYWDECGNPSGRGRKKSIGQIKSLLGLQFHRKRQISPPLYMNIASLLQFFTQVSNNSLK